MSLTAPGVGEIPCRADAAYAYRHEGLKLVLASAGRYLLLATGWVRGDGTALVIPRSDGLRLEFTAPGAALGGTC